MQDHLLHKKYTEPVRPFSKLELKEKRNSFFYHTNLSLPHVSHTKCGHLYLCKKFGKKFKTMKESDTTVDVGNCSVCWTIFHTDFNLKKVGGDLAKEYNDIIASKKSFTHYEIELEKFFHSWLYNK